MIGGAELKFVWFSPHLVIDPERLDRLLGGSGLLSSEQTKDHAAADQGQASHDQCDA